ncbi:hypothetical protein BVG19_g3412 [[Candida] boidinii]|nr:hypothetical protein BVG19_g3412 [[Candida] boidinii]OWB49117.1 hypothetical protein B5S27_g657 [[Candida] boidinii]
MSDSSKKFEFGFGNSASSGFVFTVPTTDKNKTDNVASADINNNNNADEDVSDENENDDEGEDEEIEEIMIPDDSEDQENDEEDDSEAFSEVEVSDEAKDAAAEEVEEDEDEDEDKEDEDNSEPEEVLIDDSDNMNEDSSDIAVEDEDKEEQEDEDDESEIEIDVNTGIPITKLPYKEMPIQRKNREWINQGKILNFANQASSNSSCLFLSSNLDAPQKQDITAIKPQETSLYFYQLPGEIDTSKEYIQFINQIYTSFEVLLINQNYKNYIKNSSTDAGEDEINRDDLSSAYERIGVIENYKNETEEKELTLNRLINTIIDNLNHMITIKLKNEELNNSNNNDNESDESGSDNAADDDDDETIFKYEEILYVLNLFASVKFAHPIERIASLSSWVNRADIQPTNQLVDEILNQNKTIPVFKNYKFWSLLIKKLILRGLFNEAISAIETSGFKDSLDSENSTFYLIITDLISILKSYDFIRFSENLELFIEWKKMCVLLRDNFWRIGNNSNDNNTQDSGILEILNQIYEILNILSGSSNYILDNSSTWYESLLSHYLYSMPSIDLIREYLLVSRNRFPPDQTSIWENTCIDILEGNYLTVLTSLEYLDKPIATFLGVLLEAKGLLKPYDDLDRNINDSEYDLTDDVDIDELNVVSKNKNTNNNKKNTSVVDSMLKDLSFSCFGIQKLFPIGIGILISINNSNTREIIVEVLPHYQCNTNDDFEWCLSVCAKLRLPKTASIIYKTQGQFFKDKGYNLPSLKCFSESGDLQLVTRSIWSLFEASLIQDGPIQDDDLVEYIENGEDVVNAFDDGEKEEEEEEEEEGVVEKTSNREIVKSNGILRQAMSPYVSLYKYHKNLEQGNYYESINQLINLLKFKYLPKYYMCLILIKILPFINQDENLIHLNLNDYPSDKIVKELNEISKKSIRNLIESNKLIYLIQYLNEYEEILKNDPIVLKQSNYLINMFKNYKQTTDNVNVPNNVEELLLKLRKGLGFEISLKFVNF